MVIRIARRLPLSLSVLFLGAAASVHADGILEQMQNEVSAIVKANKGGIVSIEDEGAMPPRRGAQNFDGRRGADQPLVVQLIKLQAQDADYTVQLSKAMTIYKSAHPKVVALKREKDSVDGEMQKLSAQLDKQPDAPQIKQYLTGVSLAQWTEARDALNVDLQKTQAIYKADHPHVQELRQGLHVADENILLLTKQQQGRRGGSPFDRSNAPKSGSGFSIGNGYVLTTADVVEGMQHPLIIADDGTRIHAKLVGIDSRLNMGLLQLPAKANLPALKIGNSDSVAAGHFAIAVGNQAGRRNFAALTMVSGVHNEGIRNGERFYPALIEVSGTIGAGTSGAPMLNAHGEVIGVIAGVPTGEWTETQIYSDPPLSFQPGSSGSSSQQALPNSPRPQPEPGTQGNPGGSRRGRGRGGFGPGGPPPGPVNGPPVKVLTRSQATNAGYAIPINDLQYSINELMTHGKIVQTWVGFLPNRDVKMDETDPEVLRPVRSIRIWRVEPNSPASKAGLQQGDTLLEVDSKPFVSTSELFRYLLHLQPGDKVTVMFQRNGVKQTVTLSAELRPEKIVPPSSQPTNSGRRPQ